MATNPTIIAICNMALKRVGRNLTIIDLEEDSAEARACNQFYDHCRRLLLRVLAPGFARVSEPLAVTDQTPRPGYTYEYEYPNDCLLFLGLINQVERNGKRPHSIKGVNAERRTVIWTDEELAYGEHVMDVTDANQFDLGFTEALTVFIAKNICIPLTQDKTMFKEIAGEFATMVPTAAYLDNIESRIEETPQPDWLSARN